MVVYHYTEFDHWEEIKEARTLIPRSLQSLQRELDDERVTTRATFALLDPEPKEMVDNQFFPELWQEFRGTRGYLSLDVDADPKEVLVGDAGFIEGYLYRKMHEAVSMPEAYAIQDPQIAFDRYWESLIPLDAYKEADLHYLVPEAQIRFPVSLNYVTVSHVQPILENTLGSGEIPNPLIAPIPGILRFQSDLQPWLVNFKQQNPYLEGAFQTLKSMGSGEAIG